MNPAARIFLLTTPERAGLFHFLAEIEGVEIATFASVSDLVHACVARPPQAAVVDLAGALHVGVTEMAPLFELGIDMPVLRCTQADDLEWIGMCQAPFKRVPLPQAVREIAAHDPSWRHPSHRRLFVRVPLQARLRFRTGDGPWMRGNCTSASVSGLFLLTLEPCTAGSDLELEFLDLEPVPYRLRGTASWCHHWESGPHLPGMGVEFDPESVSGELRQQLADLHLHRRPTP